MKRTSSDQLDTSAFAAAKKYKTDMSSEDGSAPAPVALDEDLHSRQLAVYGREAMRKMTHSSVLICGLKGVGVETAKNVILAGLKAVTLWDTQPCVMADLAAQFYLTDADVGTNRAEACRDKLAELNNAVEVTASTADLTKDFLAQFQAVVLTEHSLSEALPINEMCHELGIPFILGDVRGVFARVFCDFGDSFTVLDTDGEQPHSGIVASITPGPTTLVTCVEDERLEFQDGQQVIFSEVEGMAQLNGHAPVRIKNCKINSFELELDTTGFEPYVKGGIVVQHKLSEEMSFKPLAAAITEPGDFLLSDFSKMARSPMLHIAFQALDAFKEREGRFPTPGCVADGDALLSLYESTNESASDANKADVDEGVVRHLASGASGEISPMCAMFGGVLGQEVVKACSAKFTPLKQWFYFDSVESLPDKLLPELEYAPQGGRYDSQIAVFGRALQQQLGEMHVFLVGAGALGCEFIKAMAMMGIACGGGGALTLTDDDIIEKSNLSRQFLFRDWDIKHNKSTVAAKAATKMNSALKVRALENRVAPNTEDVFDEPFWDGLHLVVNALDNVTARLYVDARCVYFQKPLLESGTLGPKCNTQMVIPHKTENYGASRDPPERQAPMCTVHSFPHTIVHCLTWARSEFEGWVEHAPAEANTFLEDPEKYVAAVTSSGDAGARAKLEKVAEVLVEERVSDFEGCISWGTSKFQDHFYNRIAQLTHTFPEDAVTSTGALFWSAPKRFPVPIAFDASDAAHVAFVQAAAILKAEVHGVEVPSWGRDLEAVGSRAADVVLPDFKPKEGVKIETDPTKKAEPMEAADDDVVIQRLATQLTEAVAQLPAGARLHPIAFEKDDDTNFHMALIAGLANMRARAYSIPEVDTLQAKLTAGRIIPAIATATALATGLVALEIYKVLQSKPVEAYRNTFANLALSMYAQSEPIAPKPVKFKELSWTLWDRWVLEGDLTVQQLLDYFAEKGLEAYSMSCGPALLYNSIFPKHKDRVGQRVSELIQTIGKQTIPEGRRHLDLVVACEDDEGEDVDVPLITLRFR